MVISFGLLGPVAATVDGCPLPLGGRQRKAVLAMLVLQAGAAVAEERLIWGLWGEDPPLKAVKTLRPYLTLLRRMLEPHGIGLVRVGTGYRLDVDREDVDALKFEQLLNSGSGALAAGNPEQAQYALREALGLWRGSPLEDVADLPFAVTSVARLGELQLRAVETRIDADLALGQHHAVVADLTVLLGRHPLRESLAATLATALYRADRQADALHVLRTTRQHLADELGIDPGPRLQTVEMAVLKQDLPVPGATEAATGERVARRIPAQLPLDAHGFTGRDAELAELDAVLASPEEQSTAVVISAIAGMAGVGKTTLAVHWAHRVADRFPDGQLYVNLRGFDPTDTMLSWTEALRGFLDALHVPPQRIPADADAQTALYRSLLAGKRMLIVVDNARDSAQVRPLLPGSPGCMALVTSRNQLSGLITTEAAHPLSLDLVTTAEAHLLLADRLGAARVADEPDAVEAIIAACARLPLALAIVAARAASHPAFPLTALADELRSAQLRLDALSGEDPATDLRAVFSWSYQKLTPDAARLFRLLALQPGPDISALAAASLADSPLPAVRALLTKLARGHLIVEETPARYTLHDLLRAYATEQTHALDTDADRRSALQRVLDHYLHTADTAALHLSSIYDTLSLEPPQPGVTPEDIIDYGRALTWFTAERPVLAAAVAAAVDGGFDAHAWQLTGTFTTVLERTGHWHELAGLQRAALAAARRSASLTGQARAHRVLGTVCTMLGRGDEGRIHLNRALDLFGDTGDRAGKAHTHLSASWVCNGQDQPQEALDHAHQAFILYRDVGHRSGQANALSSVGRYHAQSGDPERAVTYCEQAVILFRETRDRYGEGGAWGILGYAYHRLGHHQQAITCYEPALEFARQTNSRHGEAITLADLGDCHYAAGNLEAARSAWQAALTIFEGFREPGEFGSPNTEQIRAKIQHLDNPGRNPEQPVTR